MKRKTKARGVRVEFGGGFGQCGHLHFAPDVPKPWFELSQAEQRKATTQPLLKALFPSRIGYFPNASQHRIHRPHGIGDTVFKYCIKGVGWCELEKRRFEVGAGDLLVVPAEVPHRYGADERRPWTIHWFHAVGEHLPLLMARLGVSRAHPVVHLGVDTQLVELLEEARILLEGEFSFARHLYASQLLTHAIGRMLRCHEEHHAGIPDAPRRVLRSVEYMTQHLDDVPDVETLAAVANLSKSYYSTLFRRTIGCSPRNHALRLRMQRGAHLLATTSYNVGTIARMLGFADPLYFSRRFHLAHQLSPSEYRRKFTQSRAQP